jgi:hypothetical protein
MKLPWRYWRTLATWRAFDIGIMRYSCCCCGQLHFFVRINDHGKCILLQLQYYRRRRQKRELQDTEEGLDNPLFAEGTRYDVLGIGLFCQWKLCGFTGMAWHGEWVSDGLELIKMFDKACLLFILFYFVCEKETRQRTDTKQENKCNSLVRWRTTDGDWLVTGNSLRLDRGNVIAGGEGVLPCMCVCTGIGGLGGPSAIIYKEPASDIGKNGEFETRACHLPS